MAQELKPKNLNLKDLPLEERPRERLLAKGVASLSAVELLAIILGKGVPGESIISLSSNLISKFGGLSNIGKISVEEFISIKGLGVAKSCQLVASFELARRISGGTFNKSKVYSSATDVYKLIRPYLMSREKEHFLIVCLDSRRRLISIDNLSIGTVSQILVHPREVFKPAIIKSASYVILAHNHPSGDTSPSFEDLQVTERLIEASKLLGIPIIDHLIVSDANYLSFKDEEYLEI